MARSLSIKIMNIDSKIEAILFYKNEPVSVREMARLLRFSSSEIEESLEILDKRLRGGGLILMRREDDLSLGTNPGVSPLIEEMVKGELARDLGVASLDTLSIILYYGPIGKAQIDNIRGVNSSFILRNLLIRGLIAREVNDKDQRSFLYKPTIDLLAYLGIQKVELLDGYKEARTLLSEGMSRIEKDEKINRETQK